MSCEKTSRALSIHLARLRLSISFWKRAGRLCTWTTMTILPTWPVDCQSCPLLAEFQMNCSWFNWRLISTTSRLTSCKSSPWLVCFISIDWCCCWWLFVVELFTVFNQTKTVPHTKSIAINKRLTRNILSLYCWRCKLIRNSRSNHYYKTHTQYSLSLPPVPLVYAPLQQKKLPTQLWIMFRRLRACTAGVFTFRCIRSSKNSRVPTVLTCHYIFNSLTVIILYISKSLGGKRKLLLWSQTQQLTLITNLAFITFYQCYGIEYCNWINSKRHSNFTTRTTFRDELVIIRFSANEQVYQFVIPS